MAGNTLATRHVPGAPQEPRTGAETTDPSMEDAVRIVRVVEERFSAGHDRARHIVLGKGAVLALGTGLVLGSGIVLYEFVHAVVAQLGQGL